MREEVIFPGFRRYKKSFVHASIHAEVDWHQREET